MQRIAAETSVTTFSAAHDAVAAVAFGESFVCETHDCYAGQITSEAVLRPDIDMRGFNRATGPVRVAGANAGDAIRIEVESIDLRSPGVMALAPGLGVLGERVEVPSTRIVPVADGTAWVTPTTPVAVQPMIGVLGLAPAGEAIPTSWPGDHGGNLDTRLLQAGTALHLRAAHDGALIALGDLHALQGDGELGGTGIEIAGAVRLRVEPSSYPGALPALRHPSGLSVLGSAETLEQATRRAFSEAVDLMRRWHGLSWDDAYRLTSVVCRTELSQMVNPRATVRVTIPAEWLPSTLDADDDA